MPRALGLCAFAMTWSLALALRLSRVPLRMPLRHLASTSGPRSEERKLSVEEQEIIRRRIKKHQLAAPKPSAAEEVRTLVAKSSGYATLSSNSVHLPGSPFGSFVGFSLDESGNPFTVLSSLANHTHDLNKDGRCSLMITDRNFRGAATGRVTLVGAMRKAVDAERRVALKDLYLKRHPDAFWVDFGDFDYFVMDPIDSIRFVGGFGNATTIKPTDYYEAQPDPLWTFADVIVKHMNDHHRDSLVAMVQRFLATPCADVRMLSVDQMGVVVNAKFPFEKIPQEVRLPFPHLVTERQAIKDVIVEMSRVAPPGQKQQ